MRQFVMVPISRVNFGPGLPYVCVPLCSFWTSEYGVSWVRGPPEGPKSCHQDARRPSGTLQRSPSLALQCILYARGVWDLVDDHQFKSFSEVTSRGQLSVLLKRR